MTTYTDLPWRADTYADLCAILDAVEFAPLNLRSWAIEPVRLGASGTIYAWAISPRHSRPDRDTGELAIGGGRAFLVHMCDTRDQVARTAWLALKTLLDHEALEGFKVGGVRLFDPHAAHVAGG